MKDSRTRAEAAETDRCARPSARRLLGYAALFGAAILVRAMFASQAEIPLRGDAGHYFHLANHLIHEGYYGVDASPDNLRTPGYPLVLALVAKVFYGGQVGTAAFTSINFVSDLLSVFLLLVLGARLGLALALPGVVFISLSPLWFGNINSAVTEPMSITLLLAFVERWTRRGAGARDLLWGGAYLGALSVTRSMYFFFPAGVALFQWGVPFLVAAHARRRGARERAARERARGWEAGLAPAWRPIAAFLAAAYLFPVAWGVRNLISVGEFSMTQPIIAATMAYTSVHIPLMDFREPDLASKYFQLPLIQKADHARSPAEYKETFAEMRREVRDHILHHPGEFFANFWVKLPRLWVTGWSNPYSYLDPGKAYGAIYVGVFCVPVLVLGLIGLLAAWRRSWSEKDPLRDSRFRLCMLQAILVLYITAVTTPLIVDSRYSMNAYVLFALWMGAGWSFCFGGLAQALPAKAIERRRVRVVTITARGVSRASRTVRPARTARKRKSAA